MSRRKKAGGHENHERWLVSYADFITLLFAFFVVMFANSTDKQKAARVSESVKKALEEGKMASVVSVLLGGTVDDQGRGNAQLRGPGGARKSADDKRGHLAELLPSLKVLSAELSKEIENGEVVVSMQPRGLAVSFKEATLFASGDDTVNSRAYESMAKVAAAINKLPNPVRLEGHTDSIPIHTARFRSNWELSASRSIAILELLATRYSVPRSRMSIGGYADTAPIDSNNTEEGRARNRRCDIIILNETGALAEPESHAPDTPPAHPSPH